MNLKHYLIAITLCAPYLLSLLGCKNHQDANERDLLTIHIKDYENKTIPRPAVISNIDTIELDTHGYFMSDIKTVCIKDLLSLFHLTYITICENILLSLHDFSCFCFLLSFQAFLIDDIPERRLCMRLLGHFLCRLFLFMFPSNVS